MKNKTIAIHQPNFFPWLGFFDKIVKSDVFVYLDHVLNNPRTAIWFKRVKILVNKEEYWLSLPLKHAKDIVFYPLNEMEIDITNKVIKKQLKTIEQSYKKAPFFNTVYPLILKYYESTDILLTKRNIDFIENICQLLGIDTIRVKSSEMDCKQNSNELLIEIIEKLNGNIYLCGGGSQGYQDDEKYLENNIEVQYQNYVHPIYNQFNRPDFIKGLSIIDLLMNMGIEGAKEIFTF